MTVWITEEILTYVHSSSEKWLPKETGGILMGYIVGNEFVVTDIIGPGPKAVHRDFSFEPDQNFHKSEIAKIYNLSNRTITYIGDWHTHPNSKPYLSDQDKKAIKNIAAFKKARLPTPLMLISAPPMKDFAVWIFEKTPEGKDNYILGDVHFY